MPLELDFQSASFLNYGLTQGVPARDLCQAPEKFQARFGANLTDEQLSSIRQFSGIAAKSGVPELSADGKAFVRHVVADGRFLLDWQSKPEEVADRLGYPISPEVADELRLTPIGDIVAPSDPTALRGLGLVSFAIAVIVAAADVSNPDATIIDVSRVEKL